jgi:hypothetical protein
VTVFFNLPLSLVVHCLFRSSIGFPPPIFFHLSTTILCLQHLLVSMPTYIFLWPIMPIFLLPSPSMHFYKIQPFHSPIPLLLSLHLLILPSLLPHPIYETGFPQGVHSACSLFGLFFDPEDEGRMYLGNISNSTRLHGITSQKIVLFK